MNPTTRNTLIAVVIVIVLVLLGYLVLRGRQASEILSPGSISATSTSATSTSATSTGVDVTVTGEATSTGGYTVTPITTPAAPTAPNYKTPLTFAAGFDAGMEAEDQSQFAAAQTTIASNPTDYNAWLELGILRKETGDYQGAAADWKYVTELYPKDPTAFANLGDLYANYLHEPTQAITYYKDAIKTDPTKEATFYENLAQVYISEGDTADAKATLQQGIDAQVVGYQNLQTQLNSLQ